MNILFQGLCSRLRNVLHDDRQRVDPRHRHRLQRKDRLRDARQARK